MYSWVETLLLAAGYNSFRFMFFMIIFSGYNGKGGLLVLNFTFGFRELSDNDSSKMLGLNLVDIDRETS